MWGVSLAWQRHSDMSLKTVFPWYRHSSPQILQMWLTVPEMGTHSYSLWKPFFLSVFCHLLIYTNLIWALLECFLVVIFNFMSMQLWFKKAHKLETLDEVITVITVALKELFSEQGCQRLMVLLSNLVPMETLFLIWPLCAFRPSRLMDPQLSCQPGSAHGNCSRKSDHSTKEER